MLRHCNSCSRSIHSTHSAAALSAPGCGEGEGLGHLPSLCLVPPCNSGSPYRARPRDPCEPLVPMSGVHGVFSDPPPQFRAAEPMTSGGI